ncbi:hypothetical protein BH23ACT2_BH23ACT2_07370 [soil metagenome]
MLVSVLVLLPLLGVGGTLADMPPASAQAATSPEVVEVKTLSGRADLVTGGDALVEVTVPTGADPAGVRVDVDGNDVTSSFVERDGALLGLVDGLADGPNVVTAILPDGRGARLDVTNAPLSGPVFAGPQIEPWTCNDGTRDNDCFEPPTVDYHYQSTSSAPGEGLQSYDPENPPSDVATTTTDDGNEVPFIVREETGVSLRDEYKIAALLEPDQQPDPTAENPGYNNKVVLTHGFSCDTAYEMASAPDVLLEDALGQGFAVASHALDNAGHNCNLVTEAESLVVTKELVAERFGPIRYTIGTGCSGGSLVQQQVANAYPGVYQGILPQCSFTDTWSSAQQYIDFVGLRAYLESPEGIAETGIVPGPQYEPVYGHPNPANAISFTESIPNSGEPSRDCPGVPPEEVYDADTNPDGVRCTLQDYMVNVFGEDENGNARRPIGNTGIQYGLSGLQDGILLPNQFVALNSGIGGFDLDLNKTVERTAADPLAMERVYRSGAVNTGAHLDEVAIIDMGGPEPGAFHDVYRKYSMRDRLQREHGTFANQVFWEGQTPLLGDESFVDDGIRKMDEWLAVIEADERDVPLPQKVIEAKDEAGVAERCVAADGTDAPLELCDGTVDSTIFSSPRIEAGGGSEVVGFADDTLDCQLMPLDDADYGDGATFAETFTPAEQTTMRETFPDGVCDYSKPSIGQQDAVTWLTYQDDDGSVIPGGEPLGPAPVSVPFGPDEPDPGPGTTAPDPEPGPGTTAPDPGPGPGTTTPGSDAGTDPTTPDSSPAPEPGTDTSPTPGSGTDPMPGPERDPGPDPEPVAGSSEDPGPVPAPAADADAVPSDDADSQPSPGPGPDSAATSDPGARPDPDAAPASGPSPEQAPADGSGPAPGSDPGLGTGGEPGEASGSAPGRTTAADPDVVEDRILPRTGSATGPAVLLGLALLGAGIALGVARPSTRRSRPTG